MKALSTGTDPSTACRPFDKDRNGFVMGKQVLCVYIYPCLLWVNKYSVCISIRV